MKFLIDTFKKTGRLHHGYLLEGDRESIWTELAAFLEDFLDFPIQGNPDFWRYTLETLGIDDARALKEASIGRPLSQSRRVFLIETLSATVEAQNALLKLFEEPGEDTHFFIVAPSADLFLPTVRSRLIVVSHTETGAGQTLTASKEVAVFMNLTPAERLKAVNNLVEGKDKAAIASFIDGIIKIYAEKVRKEPTPARQETMSELLALRGYAADRSPSNKLILEHIALIV